MAGRRIHPLITPKELRRRLKYNPITGWLMWRIDVTCANGRIIAAAGSRAGGIAVCKKDGYARRLVRVNNISYQESRVIWAIVTGKWPTFEIDHDDGDATNNKWRNLRQATTAQNAANRPCRSDSSIGLKGVCLNRSGRFSARIKRHLGTYKTAQAAAAAYARAAGILDGAFLNLKPPRDRARGPGASK